MNIRKAKLEDLDVIVEYNYNLAYETEDKELDKAILTLVEARNELNFNLLVNLLVIRAINEIFGE